MFVLLHYTGTVSIDPFAVQQESGLYEVGFNAWYDFDEQYLDDRPIPIYILSVMIDHASGNKEEKEHIIDMNITQSRYHIVSPCVDHKKYSHNMTSYQIDAAMLRFSRFDSLQVNLDVGDKIHFTFSKYLEPDSSYDGFEITDEILSKK